MVAFYNQRGIAEQWMKEAIARWTQLSRRAVAVNQRVFSSTHSYNLGHFMRTLSLPGAATLWPVANLGEKLVKSARRVVSHGC